MNEEKRWLLNDRKVEDLRNRMLKEREIFRQRNPTASGNAEETYLARLFQNEAQFLMKEQLSIISSGLRSKSEKYLY